MTGPEFAAIRKRLFGPDRAARIGFGRALGFTGTDESVDVSVRRLEAPNGGAITPTIERLARMYDRHGVPKEAAE